MLGINRSMAENIHLHDMPKLLVWITSICHSDAHFLHIPGNCTRPAGCAPTVGEKKKFSEVCACVCPRYMYAHDGRSSQVRSSSALGPLLFRAGPLSDKILLTLLGATDALRPFLFSTYASVALCRRALPERSTCDSGALRVISAWTCFSFWFEVQGRKWQHVEVFITWIAQLLLLGRWIRREWG